MVLLGRSGQQRVARDTVKLQRSAIRVEDGFLDRVIVFYFPSAYTACDWFWPKSNLCGLPAMMIAAPIGAMVGGIIGWRVGCRNSVRLPGRTRQRHSRDDHGARQESRHTRPLMRSCVFVQVD